MVKVTGRLTIPVSLGGAPDILTLLVMSLVIYLVFVVPLVSPFT